MAPTKRKQLLMVIGATAVLAVVLWSSVIRAQDEAAKTSHSRLVELNEKIEVARRGVQLAEQIRKDYELSQSRLDAVELSMAEGDLYRWVINTMRRYQTQFEVDVSDLHPPEVMEFKELPRVPYQMAVFSVLGTGRFHDIGRFLAELENDLPFLQVQELELSSTASPVEAISGRDTVAFQIRFSMLIRDSSTREPRAEP